MNINDLSCRAAMGLQSVFSPSTKDVLINYYEKYRQLPKEVLARMVEDKDLNLLTRYVIGHLLGLIGDPRISVFNPTMIKIPAAEVEIGINRDEVEQVMARFPDIGLKKEWLLKEVPRFKIEIDSFKVSKYLVTNQEYREFLIDSAYDEIPRSWEFGIYPDSKSNHPVHTVSFAAAIKYTQWLSSMTQKKYRLLTEWEWEYAAAGKTHREFPWGNELNNKFANTLEAGFYSTTPVGIFAEGNSPFGISDMAGNVEEYVNDEYQPYPGGEVVLDDIARLYNGSYRICRGGSFARRLDLARCSRRHGIFSKEIYVYGFRISESI